MQKAKSRIKKIASRPKNKLGKTIAPSRKKQKRNYKIPAFLKKYLSHLPTLLLSLPFYIIVWRILIKTYPKQIQNFILSDSYLPLLIPFFLGNLFFFSFLFLKTRRGLLTSILINILLVLHLQKIWLTWQISLSIGAFFVIIELVLNYFNDKKL